MHRWLKLGFSSLLVFTTSGSSWALDPVDTSALVNAITVERIREHLEELQAIAARHDNVRSLGTRGYERSGYYVANRLVDAGFSVRLQPFTAQLFEENTPPVLIRTAPNREAYKAGADFVTMEYSGSGNVQAALALAGGIVIPPTSQPSSQSGCTDADFPASTAGKVVLVQRGTCTFFEKAVNAREAGAVGVLIFNEGNPGRTEVLDGTLGGEVGIPVVGTTFAVGEELYRMVRAGSAVQISLKVDTTVSRTQSFNVIGEKRGRVSHRTVIAGAHLDSVEEGPGINDNGSGTATLLTIAQQMSALGIQPRNTVRFAFWGAEEVGLVGSDFYVNSLTPAQLSRIELNLNFDMLGSPNYVRFVYDGDGSIGDEGPPGSAVIEQVFTEFFQSRRMRSEPTEFDGRSDYQAFIEQGIPAGGLFSGAGGIKTVRQARIYGGRAGVPYDRCYHEACDDISNLDNRALRELGQAAAHAVLTFAMTRENIRPAASAQAATAGAARNAEYRGPHLVR